MAVPVTALGTEAVTRRALPTTVEEMEKVLASPYLWAETYLTNPKIGTPFKANIIQERILSAQHRHNILRVHRRAGKSYGLVILTLYYAITMQKGELLYIAPRMNQVEAYWDELERFIDAHPFLKAAVVGGTKKPFVKRFSNGTVLKGFTTGSSSKGKGDSIRGQGGDVVFLDEVALMHDEDFAALDAIIEGDVYRRFPTMVYAASTPQGSFGKFYEWCTDDRGLYNQICVPIDENPLYSAADLARIRAKCSERQWLTEYLVRFLDAGASVFSPSLIKRARRGPDYAVTPMPPRALDDDGRREPKRVWRTMGVDWDKFNADGSGPNIAILECDERPPDPKTGFRGGDGVPRVIYRESMPQHPMAHTRAVARVIELNQLMTPDAIYVDPGQGELNIETFHLYGQQHPGSGLEKKVFRCHFGSHVLVSDPGTNELVKKPFKPFMINLLGKWFEDDMIEYAHGDATFEEQLTKYRIVNRTINSVTYSKENEHIIDAVGMACVALFQIHKSEFRRRAASQSYLLPSPDRISASDLPESVARQLERRDPVGMAVLRAQRDPDHPPRRFGRPEDEDVFDDGPSRDRPLHESPTTTALRRALTPGLSSGRTGRPSHRRSF